MVIDMATMDDNAKVLIKNKRPVYFVKFDFGNTGWTIFPEKEDKILSKKILTAKLWNDIKTGLNPEQATFLNAEFKKWRRVTGE